jgi:hypothetical protein
LIALESVAFFGLKNLAGVDAFSNIGAENEGELMTTIIPDLGFHVEEQEENWEEPSTQEGELSEEDGPREPQMVCVIHKEVAAAMLTVAQFHELAASEGDAHCTQKIFMDDRAVQMEHGVLVTRYRVVVTTVTESEVFVGDLTIKDLLNAAHPGDSHPPNVIHISAGYPGFEEESAGGAGGKGKGMRDKGKSKSEERGQHDADGKDTNKSDEGKGKSEDRGQHDADGEQTQAENDEAPDVASMSGECVYDEFMREVERHAKRHRLGEEEL